ncbi:hypothetical protein [Caulobacter vibrioides]|uniref:Uncharacterized protein n=1 Tax=Caulobacter phage S2B TaxID=2759120 RepID=A0AAE7ML58_9CAUD|nr:hypothetical protein [Caulobacter vibrioides]QOC54165.1 hypothetical protein [Caulobacter phage S2B]QXZ53883.1 hypothetical protein KZH45_09520 [Caulobacter vibrioides]
MKFQYPYIQTLGGRRTVPCWAVTAGSDYLWFDLGQFSVDFYWGLRWFSRDFRIAKRLHALVGLLAYSLAVILILPVALALLIVGALKELLDAMGGWLADNVFDPTLDVLVPVRRYGIRATYAALFKMVTR